MQTKLKVGDKVLTKEHGTYYYKDGTQVKSGDICFYSEMPYSTYADSIVAIVEIDGILKSKTFIVTNGEKYVEVNADDKAIDLKYSVRHGDTIPVINDYTRLGTSLDNANYLTVEYAEQYRPFQRINF